MCPAKQPDTIEDTMQVPVNRTRELSNKLALLPKTDLVLLRRIYHTPNDEEAKQIITTALQDEYTIQELKLALAALDGVHKLPLSEKPLGFENATPWKPTKETTPLPPQRTFSPPGESPPLPSVKATQEISDILVRIPLADFQWLLKHYNDTHDLRSRLIIIKNRLYQYQWEDVAATLAALRRTIPENESD
ncbi:MAG: hypothetical protein ACXACH_03030 [Candidatus Hermodarchaeia archaeon]|jgi:hypothetical protein